MMARCVQLARDGAALGEYPFGSLVAFGDVILGEGVNHVIREADESRHAEIIAIAQARRTLGAKSLRECTLYTTVEPCAMCAFVIRAAGLGRVVFALHSPVMGGMSRWDILRHQEPRFRLLYGMAPEIVAGVHADETHKLWSNWRPLIARAIALLGFFVRPKSNIRIESHKLRTGQRRHRAF